jgi:hypothetical protein
MDWNENDYHCRQSGVRTQGPDTAVRPVSLTAGRSKPLNESLNESDGISPESGRVDPRCSTRARCRGTVSLAR